MTEREFKRAKDRVKSRTYYYKHRDEILAKRKAANKRTEATK